MCKPDVSIPSPSISSLPLVSSSSAFAVDLAGSEDIPLLAALERRCFSDPWTEGMFRGMMGPERSRYYIARTADTGTPVAYAGLSWVLDEGSLDNIATLPEFRRKGAAEVLLSAIEADAETLGLSFLTLEVRISNTPAVALYQKRGYLPVGRRKNYYGKPREDALLMTRILLSPPSGGVVENGGEEREI